MKVYFVNPPFKAEYGKFSRENRSPAVTRSGTLYYPLWLIYAGAVCEKDGFDIRFLDAPATPWVHRCKRTLVLPRQILWQSERTTV